MRSITFLLFFSLTLSGFPIPEPPVSIEVKLNDGKSFSGIPVSFRNEILLIRQFMETGEIERGFPKNSIAEIRFSDSEKLDLAADLPPATQPQERLRLLEEIWQPRARFLPLLGEQTLSLLTDLPNLHLISGDTYRAISLAERMLPFSQNQKTSDRLAEIIILAHFKLGFHPEVSEQAREWIDRQPRFPESALGWRMLAELALLEEKFTDLLWITLQPIALNTLTPIDHLADCYALAIHALDHLDDSERASELFTEMKKMRLPWPDTEQLHETGTKFAEIHNRKNTKTNPEPEPALDLRPPEKDLNLPITEVRKSVSKF